MSESDRKKEQYDESKSVSSYYNRQSLRENHPRMRNDSRIVHLRNFNNFMKSILLTRTIDLMRKQFGEVNVLDLCCGKGGDAYKWINGQVDSVVFTDVAEIAVSVCEQRFLRANKGGIDAEFVVADCTKENIWELVNVGDNNKKRHVQLTSCMFALHYGFASIEQAYKLLENACSKLVKGGRFIGILPNAYEIVDKLRNGHRYENEICSISTEEGLTEKLFGAQYHFSLEGVVDCPEFLVYFPLLESILETMNMRCVYKSTLHDFAITHFDEFKFLQRRIQPFKIFRDAEDISRKEGGIISGLDYSHVLDADLDPSLGQIYTLSKEEWEVVALYTVFEFEKLDDSTTNSWDILTPVDVSE